jgi:hypothetical protein
MSQIVFLVFLSVSKTLKVMKNKQKNGCEKKVRRKILLMGISSKFN